MYSICTTRGLEKLQEQQRLVPLGMDELVKWSNSLVIVPKSNGTVCSCLDLARRNQTFIRHIHRKPTLNDILPTITDIQYMTIIDARSGYHNLKHDKKTLYLTEFACQFGMYRFTRIPFGVAPSGNRFQ